MTAAPTTQTAKRGRPRLPEGRTRVPSYDSRLTAFLQARLPKFVIRGRLNVSSLAEAADISRQVLYRYLQDERLTMSGAAALINASEGVLTPEDLAEFVIQS